MIIATAFSPDWVVHMKVSLAALMQHGPPTKVYMLSDSLTEGTVRELQAICPCAVYIDMSDWGKNVKVNGRFTRYTMLRLALPSIANEDKILYLDADTLAVASLKELWETDMTNYDIAGVIDKGFSPRQRRIIGYKDTYFNAGVMLLNLSRIRNLEAQWAEMSLKSWPCNDQDILNLTCPAKLTLDSKWNWSKSTSTAGEPAIVHYAGDKRNWVRGLPGDHYWYNQGPEIIPRTVTYCWFGGNPETELVTHCKASWVAQGYDVTRLDETNCDPMAHPYTKAAYEQKKWAYVSDYFRLNHLYINGGISVDSDVEIVRPLTRFLKHSFFSGQEVNKQIPITALIAAKPSHPLVKLLLTYLDTVPFKVEPNTKHISAIFNTFIEYGTDGIGLLPHDGWVYPQDYFCPYDHRRRKTEPTSNTYALHHFAGSWK